jgi:hypothetical protein
MTINVPTETTRRARGSRPGRFRLAFLVIVGAIAVLILLAFRPPANEQEDLQPAIGAAAARVGTGRTIDLAAVTDFAWDRVYLFLAYSGQDAIREGLGFDWVPASPAMSIVIGDLLLPSDELSLLVFVRGDRDVAGWTILNSDHRPPFIQFDLDAMPDYFAVYPHDAATFRVTDVTGQLGDPALSGWELSSTGQ